MFYAGYCLAPCSFGFSLLMPNSCIKDAEKSLLNAIDYFNRDKLGKKGHKIVLVKRCSTSWLELHLNKDYFEESEQ